MSLERSAINSMTLYGSMSLVREILLKYGNLLSNKLCDVLWCLGITNYYVLVVDQESFKSHV